MKLKLAILPLCLIALQVFGFEGTIKQTVKNYNGAGNDVTMTWYLGTRSCRIDMAASGKELKAASNTVLLLDPSAKTLRTYEAGGSGEKVYFQAPASAISGDAVNVGVSKTAETKKIQGYNCEKWTVTSNGASYDVWITRDIDFDASAYKELFKGSMEIQALAQQGVKGFAMLTESHTGANAASVEKVAAQVLPAETFNVPSDYKLFVANAGKPKGGK